MDDGNTHRPGRFERVGGASRFGGRFRQPVKWKNHYHPELRFEYDEYRWGRLV